MLYVKKYNKLLLQEIHLLHPKKDPNRLSEEVNNEKLQQNLLSKEKGKKHIEPHEVH